MSRPFRGAGDPMPEKPPTFPPKPGPERPATAEAQRGRP